MEMEKLEKIKKDIILALSHPEAEDGLYLDNLLVVHEEEERQIVHGEQEEVLEALRLLILEGKVEADDSGEKVIFLKV